MYPKGRTVDFDIPLDIKSSLEEAIGCEQNDLFQATVVMVGRTLEAISKHYDPSIKTIQSGLNRLLEDGVISQEIFDWSNELRLLRNIGAHASKEIISKEDTVNSMDFLMAIISIIFDLRVKFQKIKEAKKDKSATY